jgi:hypothetical protein
MQKFLALAGIFSGVPFALIYGALARFVFTNSGFDNGFGVISLAFLVFMPVASGALTVLLAPPGKRQSGIYAFFMPWLASGLAGLLAGILAYEYAICIAMALPVMFFMSSAGGMIVWFIRTQFGKSANTVVGALLLLPYIIAPIESHFPVADSYHTVDTQIEINAPAPVVWRNITRVAPIQPGERHFSLLFDVFGAPRPLEAQLASDGTGAMRRGVFAGGLFFNEQITTWDENRRLDFEITAENRLTPNVLASFAPWSEIGGASFAVPQASYRLEPLPNGHIMLHLSSVHRLSTRFNNYGALWTSWGMSEFQNQILQIVKERAEAGH